MDNTLEFEIECQACNGTGIYSGMGEGPGVALICKMCKGTGKSTYKFEYNNFTGRKKREDIERVYLKGYGYHLGLGKINFDNVGEIDMTKEGVTYEEFLQGKMPNHIEALACPMRADQSACHDVKGFVDECNKINGGFVSYIPSCSCSDKKECWKRFKKGKSLII